MYYHSYVQGGIFLLVSLTNVYAFAPHQRRQPCRRFTIVVDAKKTTDKHDTSRRTVKQQRRSPDQKKKRKGVPRSKAKNIIDRNDVIRTKTFVQKPPPLLVDYDANYWEEEQDRRLRDDSIGQSCEHYQDCPGCSVGVYVADAIVRAAKRYFAQDRYDGTSRTAADHNNNDEYYDDDSYPVVIPSKTTGWRTQAKLVAANKSKSSWLNDGCVFGLYRQKSHELLPIPACRVHHQSINNAVGILEQATKKAGVAAFSEDSRDGDLRYVQLQVERVSGKICLTLVWNAATLKECQPSLARLMKELNKEQQVFHSIWCHCNDSLGNNIFSKAPGRWHRLSGPEFLREPLPVASGNANNSSNESVGWLYFTPLTFRQGNLDGFDILALDVARAVPGGSKVCELYGGVGVLGLTVLAHQYQQGQPLQWLRCSDENPSNPRCFYRAVDSLPREMTGRQSSRRNKRGGRSTKRKYDSNGHNDSDGMTLAELARLMESDGSPSHERSSDKGEKTSYMIATAAKALKSGQALGADILVVDPPRRGLEDEVLDELCKPFNPDQPYVESSALLTIPDDKVNWTNDIKTLIYVSCGFDALARDCDRLLSSTGGWTLQSSTGYILFPVPITSRLLRYFTGNK